MDVLRQFRSDDHLRSLYDRREEAQRVVKGMDLELQDALRQAEAKRKTKEAALVQAEAERREKEAAQHALATLMEELAALRARSAPS